MKKSLTNQDQNNKYKTIEIYFFLINITELFKTLPTLTILWFLLQNK